MLFKCGKYTDIRLFGLQQIFDVSRLKSPGVKPVPVRFRLAAQHSCAGVPKIMRSNDFQVILLKKLSKVSGNVIRLEQCSHVIDKDKIQIVGII